MEDDKEVMAIRAAAMGVRLMRDRTDPGHIPMRQYLLRLAQQLSAMASELSDRIDKESGG